MPLCEVFGRNRLTAVMLAAHGTRPGEWKDAFDQKKQLYWHNARRNRRIAEVARTLVRGKKALRSLVEDEELIAQIASAAKSGVAILVETPAHACKLAALLPGWVIWTDNDMTGARPEPGCGVITTERAARSMGVKRDRSRPRRSESGRVARRHWALDLVPGKQ